MKANKETKVKNSRKYENTKTEKIIGALDRNRKIIYGFVGGVLITSIIATIIWPDRIATLKDGTQPIAEINGEKITADIFYEDLKEKNSISLLLNIIDNIVLSEKYEETDELKNEVEKIANNYYAQYEQYYGGTKEDFLAENGFKSHDELIEVLTLNYRRNKYFEEYTESLVTEDEINKYYEKDVYGDIDSKHMLVTIDEERKDEDALKLANEIIGKLNEGKTFDEVKEEYKDSITYEELGYQPFNANIQESYMNALEKLENNKYTTEAVKTTYGYHIIYRIDQKEKPSLEDSKDAIIDELAADKKEADENLYYKALESFREEKGLNFFDTVMDDKYKEYLKSYK